MSLGQWRQQTGLVSSSLVSAGKELGAICMATTIDPDKKVRQYLSTYLGAQGLLSEKWREFSSKEAKLSV